MRGGKALRPAMLTWACQALGGNADAAMVAGLAVELYHTYTLVHDDIIDRDPLRRGQPSVHALMAGVGREAHGLPEGEAAHYGLSMAILAGDCLHTWAIHALAGLPEMDVDPAVALKLISRMQGLTGPAIVEGETRDIQLPFRPVDQVTEADILRVIETKTAALFAYCGWAGGLLARGVENEHVRALETFGAKAGMAFQLQDDVLGIVGDAVTLGKPVGGDLREGKRTLIIALAWARADEAARATLSAALGNPHATPEAIANATRLLQDIGAVRDVQAIADRYLHEALACLDVLPAGPPVALLREAAQVMVQRAK
jgi:geranylgeranyl diphosphate synthase type I